MPPYKTELEAVSIDSAVNRPYEPRPYNPESDPPAKVVQIAVTDNALYALREDGAIWRLQRGNTWERIAAIPD